MSCLQVEISRPVFCQLISTYTDPDPFTSSSLLTSASLGSCRTAALLRFIIKKWSCCLLWLHSGEQQLLELKNCQTCRQVSSSGQLTEKTRRGRNLESWLPGLQYFSVYFNGLPIRFRIQATSSWRCICIACKSESAAANLRQLR